jgi:hypothetical protein
MASVSAVLLVVTQRLRHGRRNPEIFCIDERPFDSPVTGKVSKHLDPKRDMPAPSGLRRKALASADLMCIYKASRQFLGVLIAQVHPTRKRCEMLPNGAVAPQRSPAVRKLLQFAQGVRNKLLNRQVRRRRMD